MWPSETTKRMAYWYRLVFLLAFPLILSNLTQPLLSTVDTVLSCHLPGAAALGGVAMGGIFFNTVYWTFGFWRMGTTGLVAQAHGAEQHDRHRHVNGLGSGEGLFGRDADSPRVPLLPPSFSGRGYQPCGVALFPVPPEPCVGSRKCLRRAGSA